MKTENEIWWMSVRELGEAIRRGEISPVEILESILARIAQCNPRINAIVTLDEDKAREMARDAERKVKRGEEIGPLHGIPVTVKDLIFTQGMRTTFGSSLFQDYVPDKDAVTVTRLKEAGAIILGKTNTPEFGLIAVTDNLIFGHTRNPWDTTRTSGGSSGGAAAAVATGMCPVALGSDGGGSIRIPASLCGVYGIKPSFGRIPRYPALPGFETLACEGPITRTVWDAALMIDIMAGRDDRDRFSLPWEKTNYLDRLEEGVVGRKMAYSSNLGYAVVEPKVEEVTRRVALEVKKLGCKVDEIDLDIPDMGEDLTLMVAAEAVTASEGRLEEWKKKGYPLYRGLFRLGESMSVRDYVRAQFKREKLWNEIRRVFGRYDFLLTPTTAVPAFKLEERGPAAPKEIAGKPVSPNAWFAFTYPFNFTGQPAASVPCGFVDGLPIGLQVVGNRYDDLGVLQASRAFEKAFPWQEKRPLL